jgi:hypothetical protein
MTKSKKYLFSLKNVDTDKINKKYDVFSSNINNSSSFEENLQPNNITKLTDLSENNKNTFSFLDESKRLHKCYVNMIDFNSCKNINDFHNYNCFWCRHSFDTKPIGCPVKYVSNVAVKKYYSEISKDIYTIKENITIKKSITDIEDNKIKIINNDYYETDGIFCSFNCIMAFILDNKHIRIYDDSIMLLNKMYNDFLKVNNASISPAPSWRLLIEYGGHLNINDFRNNFNKIEYEYHGIIRKIPTQESIGTIFEQKFKF